MGLENMGCNHSKLLRIRAEISFNYSSYLDFWISMTIHEDPWIGKPGKNGPQHSACGKDAALSRRLRHQGDQRWPVVALAEAKTRLVQRIVRPWLPGPAPEKTAHHFCTEPLGEFRWSSRLSDSFGRKSRRYSRSSGHARVAGDPLTSCRQS